MSGESYCPECGAVFTGLPHQCIPKILLTDEEMMSHIKDIYPDKIPFGVFTLVTESMQAQLKKVVELLKSCDGELVSRKEGPFMATFEMLATDYQELLEEVK